MYYSTTGHRPDKILPGTWILKSARMDGYSALVQQWLTQYAKQVLQQIISKEPADLVPSLMYTGMALGWDQAVATACYEIKLDYEAAVPFHGFENLWPVISRANYIQMLRRAKQVHVISDGGFAAWKLKRRNVWLVDHCKFLLALWDGSHGGTQHTIEYARQRPGVVILNVWEGWVQFRDKQLQEHGYVQQERHLSVSV